MIGGDFSCCHDQLTSLKGSPEVVKRYFSRYGNEIESLDGNLKEVGGNFSCDELPNDEMPDFEVGGKVHAKNAPRMYASGISGKDRLRTQRGKIPDRRINKNTLERMIRTADSIIDELSEIGIDASSAEISGLSNFKKLLGKLLK